MDNLSFVKKLYRGKNCYSDHMDSDELNKLHIPSSIENRILEFLKDNRIVFLTGNPGDGKTFIIKALEKELEQMNVFIETDLTKENAYIETSQKIIECYNNNTPAIIAANEYPFLLLRKAIIEEEKGLKDEILSSDDKTIAYGYNSNSKLGKIVVIDLNQRNLLSRDNNTADLLLSKMCELLKEEACSSCLQHNVNALSTTETKERVISIINKASTGVNHYVIRDILGAFSYLLTACIIENDDNLFYYNVLFSEASALLKDLKQYDPLYLTNFELDEKLWNGEILDGWYYDVPQKFPYEYEDIDSATECFKSIKRKYYFENANGNKLEIEKNSSNEIYDIFTKFESHKKRIKEDIVFSINKLFLPSSNDKKQLRIWTTHRYDVSKDASIAVSSRYIDSSDLDLEMPRPADWIKGMEYTPNHLILKPKNKSEPTLYLDMDFLSALKLIENGYPICLLPSHFEQAASMFLQRLCESNLVDENEDDEIIIASRENNYKKIITTQDNKYSFEED